VKLAERPVLAIVVLAAVAGLLWLMIPSADHAAAREQERADGKAPKPSDDDESELGLEGAPQAPSRRAGAAEPREEERAVPKLDVDSKEFFDKVDSELPQHLYAEAARRCWRFGLDRNQKIKLTYRLHVENGKVSVKKLAIAETTIEERAIESCLMDAVASATWRDDAMPDYDDEDELLIRLGGLKKHLGDDQDDSDEGGFRPSDQPKLGDDGEGAITAAAPP
jgi:hypothetical protein